jgi:hypothetical protein
MKSNKYFEEKITLIPIPIFKLSIYTVPNMAQHNLRICFIRDYFQILYY